ncbi:MAG: FAD-dependent monooxygenase [Pseudomonadota bacterium]
MTIQNDICIIGNGAIGKAAALGLAQTGASVTLIDTKQSAQTLAAPSFSAAPEPTAPVNSWDARVYALNPLARTLLTKLKVWNALDTSRVTPVEAMVVKGDDIARSAEVSFDAYSAREEALAWIVEDSNLSKALDAALNFASNIRLVRATISSTAVDDAGITVELADSAHVRAALLVGADGAHSWVRSQAGIDLDYRTYGQHAVVANFSTTLPHHGTAYQWFTHSEGIVALLPLSGHRVSLVWSAPDSLAELLAGDSLDALATRLTALSDGVLGTLAPLASGVIKSIPLSMIRPHAIIASRVALVGDAAHVIHPLAGQGMNLGFGDVDALMRAVANRGPHRDCGDPRILSRYSRERKENILLAHLATDGLQRLFATDIEPIRMARNIGLNLVNQLPVVKRLLVAHALGNRT